MLYAPEHAQGGWHRLTQIALILALGLVLSRAMMMESIRDPFDIVPGPQAILRSPGATVSCVLNLLSFLPAILVSLRVAVDREFRLRWPLSLALLIGLSLWAMLSVAWSPDRFAAAVSAGKLLGGAAIAWTLIQTVRDWKSFRIVCGALAGVLAVLAVHSLIYRFADVPELRIEWEKNKQQIIADRGWEPGSFQASQFEKKVLAGELLGFCASPNSLAALTVLLLLLIIGDLAQRIADRRPFVWWLLSLALIGLAIWVIIGAQSKTAAATPILGVCLLGVCWKWRSWIAAHHRLAFAGGLSGVLLVGAAVVAHGLRHGTLFQRSLTFRWHYWVASFALWKDHLLTGVGWENFSQYYLQYRLPIAPEEIRDPHNLLARFATELGLVGVLLAVGWLLCMFREITGRMPLSPLPDPRARPAFLPPIKAIAPLIWIAAIATLLVIVCSIDLTQDPGYVGMEVMRRVLYGILILLAAAILGIADLERPALDTRPAPLVLLAAVIGLGMFLIHNCIDFAMFETGPWYVFIAISGAVGGMTFRPGATRDPRDPKFPFASLLVWSGLGLAFAILTVLPVLLAEDCARQGDQKLAASRFTAAGRDYAAAYDSSLWLKDHDYLLRQARAAAYAGTPAAEVLPILDRVIASNPRSITAYVQRAELRLQSHASPDGVVADFSRVLELNPTDIQLRLKAAAAMESLGRPRDAAAQYQQALHLNDQFPPDEPKRLSQSRVQGIQATLKTLE